MRNARLVAAGFLFLVAQTALQRATRAPWIPDLALPFVLYLGLQEGGLARGAAIAFVLGYFQDALGGSPIGMHPLAAVIVFFAARIARLRLLLDGPLFHAVVALAAATLGAVVIVALRAIFESAAPSLGVALRLAGPRILTTAAAAPALVAVVRAIDAAGVANRTRGVSLAERMR